MSGASSNNAELREDKFYYGPCGVFKVPEKPRIVGGIEVSPPHTQPWMVLLRDKLWIKYCGGSLIAERLVLTAGHCQFHSPVVAVFGKHKFTKEDTEVEYDVKKLHRHHKYKSLGKRRPSVYDYAIAEISETVVYDNYVQPICLPFHKLDDFVGKTMTVLGWGALKFKGPNAKQLMRTNVTVMPQHECREKWNKVWGKIGVVDYKAAAIFCAADPNNYERDACKGDSGGMLMLLQY